MFRDLKDVILNETLERRDEQESGRRRDDEELQQQQSLCTNSILSQLSSYFLLPRYTYTRANRACRVSDGNCPLVRKPFNLNFSTFCRRSSSSVSQTRFCG